LPTGKETPLCKDTPSKEPAAIMKYSDAVSLKYFSAERAFGTSLFILTYFKQLLGLLIIEMWYNIK